MACRWFCACSLLSPNLERDQDQEPPPAKMNPPLRLTNSGTIPHLSEESPTNICLSHPKGESSSSSTSTTSSLTLILRRLTDVTCKESRPKAKWRLKTTKKSREMKNSAMSKHPTRNLDRSCFKRSSRLFIEIAWAQMPRNNVGGREYLMVLKRRNGLH